jgi:hypothetical protein
MGFHRGPKIVTDGLVLYLDAANTRSYPGTGNTWFDLSGYNHHAVMNNFTGASPGSLSGFDTNTSLMMFDRHLGAADGTSNNVAVVTNTDILDNALCENEVTIEMWVRATSYVCTALTRWTGSWEVYYCSSLVFRTMGTGGNDGNTGVPHTTHLGKFHHIVSTHNGTTRAVYVNGLLVATGTNVVTAQNKTNSIAIGAYDNGQYAFVGAIPLYRLYTRVLTPQEILQNYNATKSRYGL